MRKEGERPRHSLRDYELRPVTTEDRAGRFVTEFFCKEGETGGPKLWMDAFAPPVRRFVSRGTRADSRGPLDGMRDLAENRRSGFTFDGSNLPEARAMALLVVEKEHAATVEARAKAGLPRLSLEDWERL